MAVASCDSARPSASGDGLRLGVVSDASRADPRYEPLSAYLTATLGVEVEFDIRATTEDLLAGFDRGEFSVAWLDSLAFVSAERDNGAAALAVRGVDLDATSEFLTSRADGQRLADFAGSSFCFGPRLSTSGHLMPRAYLAILGLDPETQFRDVQYSKSHEETTSRLLAGSADLAVLESDEVTRLFELGVLDSAKFRRVARTPPFRNFLFAVSPELSRSTRSSLLDALLALNPENANHREALESLGADYFLPAYSSLFEKVRTTAPLVLHATQEVR
ncbi:MAG: phosphate/phosphite/phosphonate ABC transporter substrate-binding protein [Planctomycetota bacterium]